MQYIALIHRNTDTSPSPDEWSKFIQAAVEAELFQGGSEIGTRHLVGQKPVPDSTESVAGFMRFDSEDLDKLMQLLDQHPVIRHGGTIELCEMPKSE